IVMSNKTAIHEFLSGDSGLILNRDYENNLITQWDYENLKRINNINMETHVIELVDKIMNKGEVKCKDFLNSCKLMAPLKKLSLSWRVVFVLSHGEKGCVFGTDGEKVLLKELTDPFTSGRAPTLTGKPKLFFIQACQGDEDENRKKEAWQADASIPDETVPELADFLIGMSTVEECKSFRNKRTGSIYIQELCKHQVMDDILTVLTRVNREISKGEFLSYKQMPEPKYTLTKKLVLKYI
uniref:Caspase 8 n=1 Tax=Maylandia zebra TaxID=106582 RepID=A0A3P9BXV5_9CICH